MKQRAENHFVKRVTNIEVTGRRCFGSPKRRKLHYLTKGMRELHGRRKHAQDISKWRKSIHQGNP